MDQSITSVCQRSLAMFNFIWPPRTKDKKIDKLLFRIGKYPGYCTICGKPTLFLVKDKNFREWTHCARCNAPNRKRQITHVLLSLALKKNGPLASIKNLGSQTKIWNAEASGGLHNHLALQLGSNYTPTEYLADDLQSGTFLNGVLHVDMQKTHFPDDHFDYILSSDILEHIPDYLTALKECHRVLKIGGSHIFTVPFYEHRFTNERRACLLDSGSIKHFLEPWFHLDPLRPEGVLAYNIFAPELLCQLEGIGFEAEILRLHSVFHGILGNNGIVIVAKKVKNPRHLEDVIFPKESAKRKLNGLP